MSTKLILENLFRIRKVVDDIIEGSITLGDEQVEKFFGINVAFLNNKLVLEYSKMKLEIYKTAESSRSFSAAILKLDDFMRSLLKDDFYEDPYCFSTNYSDQ
jgi:hypothetical protein